jgi:hypothetical protein
MAEHLRPGEVVWISRGNVYIECEILENHPGDVRMDVRELETGRVLSVPYRKLSSLDKIQRLQLKLGVVEDTVSDDVPAKRRRSAKSSPRYNRDLYVA